MTAQQQTPGRIAIKTMRQGWFRLNTEFQIRQIGINMEIGFRPAMRCQPRWLVQHDDV